jgi:hypothetical protein
MTKAKNIYVVQGLGLGDNEDAFENMCAFTNLAAAKKQVALFVIENKLEGWENEYRVEELILN